MISDQIDLEQFAQSNKRNFAEARPFAHMVVDQFFDESFLNSVLSEFPDLSSPENNIINNPRQKKFASIGTGLFGEKTCQLFDFLNSAEFLDFVEKLTGIEESLQADLDYLGGGLHEIIRGGFLKIHTDFSKHRTNGLDRRLNLLIFLNHDWKDEYGGALELWGPQMSECKVKIMPKFNRLVIFETTSTSYHGHPDQLMCPEGLSRKSMAIYYYTDGRPFDPSNPKNEKQPTTFFKRPGTPEDSKLAFLTTIKEKVIFKLDKLWKKSK